jgi:hypothetical protein
MVHLTRLAGEWAAVGAALVVSTLAAIAAAAVTFAWVARRTGQALPSLGAPEGQAGAGQGDRSSRDRATP